jgi:hypothetical protein
MTLEKCAILKIKKDIHLHLENVMCNASQPIYVDSEDILVNENSTLTVTGLGSTVTI